MLARIFNARLCVDEHKIFKAHLRALEEGDHVFFLHFGDHSGYSFELCREYPERDWDSWCTGIVIVKREFWHRAMPRTTFAKAFVFRTLCDAFNERVTNILNGEIYAADVYDEEGRHVVHYADYLSPEAALLAAQDDYPDLKFEESDFDAVTAYRLKGVEAGVGARCTAGALS